MNCAYENYLYIYNIKLMEENTLLIKKITFKHVFVLLILKTFLLTQPNMFFFFVFKNKKIVFQNSIPKQIFFFLKTQKIVLKKRFFRTVIKNNNQISFLAGLRYLSFSIGFTTMIALTL